MMERARGVGIAPAACTLHVLVLDELAPRRKTLERELARRGLRVSACASTGSALALIRGLSIDAVAVHSGSAVGDGIETCRHISANWPDLPIVVIAEGGPLGSAIEAFQAGAYDLLVGPTHRTPVVDALEHAAQVGAFRKEKTREGRATPVPGETSEAPSPEAQVERRLLLGVLLAARGSRTRAARVLGMERSALMGRLVHLGVLKSAASREDESTVIPLPRSD